MALQGGKLSRREVVFYTGLVILLNAILGAEIDIALNYTSPYNFLTPGAIISLIPLFIYMYILFVPSFDKVL
ncbi:MAG: hypothetical protein ABEI06_02525 [Halobacteriaceae archaeon]